MILLKQMLILFFFMLIGYYMGRKKIVDEKVSKSLSWLIVNITNPALILSGGLSAVMDRTELLSTFVLAVGLFAVLILFAELVIPLFRMEKRDAGVYKALTVFSNMGFMGFPIISAVYGQEALIYASVFLLPFNVLIYTYGVFRISGHGMKPGEAAGKFLNIGTCAGILALIIAVSQIRLPDIASQTIEMLSDMTAPLCMMVIGASFLKIRFRDVFGNMKLMIFSAIRLLLIPLAGMFLIRMATADPVLQGICFIILASPAGSMVAMLAQQSDGNDLIASEGAAVTTLFSVVTMPLLFQLIGLNV